MRYTLYFARVFLFPPFDYSAHLQDPSPDHNTLPDKTNTPGCLALFVTVNAIDADALGDGGDELRRSNYRKIEAFIQLLLSKCVSLSFCDCSSMLLVATKALATREVHFLSSILASVSSPRVS
ncbi:unnamed protein product [Brassica oleracea]|uniref:(rape) hypothetical protein n=1 Tax=Brassica napus TaxID=3708 RepID=A0A816IC00_BRANA|nr:unnamed protein product [Brassica napus]